MAKDPNHLKLRAGVKQTLEQAHLALDAYFEFLKKSVSSFPSGAQNSVRSYRSKSVRSNTSTLSRRCQKIKKSQPTFKKLFEYKPLLYTRS